MQEWIAKHPRTGKEYAFKGDDLISAFNNNFLEIARIADFGSDPGYKMQKVVGTYDSSKEGITITFTFLQLPQYGSGIVPKHRSVWINADHTDLPQNPYTF